MDRSSLRSSQTLSRGQPREGSSTTPRGRAQTPSPSQPTARTNSVPRLNLENMWSRSASCLAIINFVFIVKMFLDFECVYDDVFAMKRCI